MLIAQGGASNGYALWIKNGILNWTVTRNDVPTTVSGNSRIPDGQHTVTVRQEKSGKATIAIEDLLVGEGNVGGPFLAQPF